MLSIYMLGLLMIVGVCAYCIFAASLCTKMEELMYGNRRIDAMVFHTYRLTPKGKLPWRGKVAALGAVRIANRRGIPVIIPTGFASGLALTDAVLYAHHMMHHGGSHLRIVTGADPGARTTYDEVGEAARIAREHGWSELVVVGERAHLPRIAYWWGRPSKNDLNVEFWGAAVPIHNYLREMCLIPLEALLPPHTRRRDLVLKLAHRGPPRKSLE